MPGQLNADKEKITYAEWTDVREELEKLRKDLAKKEKRDIDEAELLRYMTITAINKRRREHGQPPLELEWRRLNKYGQAA